VCVSSARTGLCGGQRVTAVPTATDLGKRRAESEALVQAQDKRMSNELQ
jgi:hypothetical protein